MKEFFRPVSILIIAVALTVACLPVYKVGSYLILIFTFKPLSYLLGHINLLAWVSTLIAAVWLFILAKVGYF